MVMRGGVAKGRPNMFVLASTFDVASIYLIRSSTISTASRWTGKTFHCVSIVAIRRQGLSIRLALEPHTAVPLSSTNFCWVISDLTDDPQGTGGGRGRLL